MKPSRMLNKIIEFVVLALVVLLCSALARATTVTGTIVDGSAQALVNAKMTVEFVPAPGTYGSPVIPTQTITLDSNGGFTITLTATNTIVPTGGTYKFTVCPNATVNCSVISGITITGTSVDISSQLNAGISSIFVNAQVLVPKAYNDTEIPITDLTNTGAIYWNTLKKSLRTWDGSTWNAVPNLTGTGAYHGEWSAFLTPGTADVCDATVKTALAMITAGLKGGDIDAATGYTGVQPCANALNGWPGTPGQTPIWAGSIRMASDADWQTAVEFDVPTQTSIGCGVKNSNFFSSSNYSGCYISRAVGNTANPLLKLGRNVSTGGVPEQGARLNGVGVAGLYPNGTALAGGTCILNNQGQENSGWDDLRIDGCTIPFDLETGGSLGGIINSGPYRQTKINMDGVTDITTNGTCFKIGTTSTGQSQVGMLENTWCSCVNTTGQCAWGGWIDANNIRFKGETKIEQAANGLRVGSAHAVQDVKFDDLTFVNFTGKPLGNAIQIDGTAREFEANIAIIGTNATTNAMVDNSLNGKTTTIASQSISPNNLHFWYKRTLGDFVQTSLKGVPSQYFTLTDLALSGSTTLNNTSHCVNISAGCTIDCTMTLPATVNTNGCDYRIINSQSSVSTPVIVTVSRNGNNINGLGQDIKLSYGDTVHIYANSSGTTWRAEVSNSWLISDIIGSATPVLSSWGKVNRLLLNQNVTSSTWPAAIDGRCSIVRIQPLAFTWVWPTNTAGAMTVVANKINEQMFCYYGSSGNWEAVNAGISF